jgi:hypothetical protein
MVERLGGFKVEASKVLFDNVGNDFDALSQGGIVAMMPSNIVSVSHRDAIAAV